MFVLRFLISLSFIQSLSAWGQIPLFYDNNPAFDLIYQNQELLPEEAHDLYIKSKKKFDLSMLNPTDSTDLWKNNLRKPLAQFKQDLGIEYMESLKFNSFVPSRSGNFRFNVVKMQGDVAQIYTLFLSKNVHQILLAQGLLRKLGYEVPAIQYLPKVQIKFESPSEKKGFIASLEQDSMADADSWIIEEPSENEIIIQDIVAMDGLNLIYNLAVGMPPKGLIQGRRLLSALSIPYAIANIPESVNLMKWQAGRVANKELILDLDYANEFQTTYEDARWIARRIETLKREDWVEIVEQAHFPKPVELLLIEKLIARRNSILRMLKINSADIKVYDQVTSGVELVKGKITQENWQGYASRFAFGDPDSPLSSSEVFSWAKSKIISYAIDSAVAGINSIPYLSTNISKLMDKSDEELQGILTENFSKVKADKIQILPLDTWILPTYKAQIGLSRSIVAGSYLGTDNLVQLADSISINLGGGVTSSWGGWLSGKVSQVMLDAQGARALDLLPISASGSADLSYMRSYTHLRPVTSVKKAMKYPFKNIFVPLVHHDYGKKLAKALSLNFSELSNEEKEKAISDSLQPFKEAMDVGESLLVTDTFNFAVSGRVGLNKAQYIRAQLGIGASQIVTMRLHVFRKTEDVIQIYQDFGELSQFQAFFSFDSYVPILKVKASLNRGTAKVKFYQLNINSKNPKIIEHLVAIRSAVVRQSMKNAKKISPPIEVNHKFNEKNAGIGLFTLRLNKINSANKIKVKVPGHEEKEFYRRYWGRTLGNDYQDYLNDVIDNTVSLLLKTNFNASSSSANPGFSFYGKAINKLVSYEAALKEDGSVQEPFIKFNRIWNGWSIKRKNAEKILSKLQTQYRFQFYEPSILANANKIYLYNISLNFMVYQKGINHMMSLSDEQIEEIFKKYQRVKDLSVSPKEQTFNNGMIRFKKYVSQYQKAQKKNNLSTLSLKAIQSFKLAELKLNIDGLTKLLGSDEHFYVFSKIDGFRVGDESGDEPIISHSLGEFGNRNFLGPISQVLDRTEMIEGEFYIYWLMTRLI